MYLLLRYLIAAVWILNGLFCKILNLVPRHEEIVSNILGHEQARLLTILIGIAELVMAIWVLSGKWIRLNAILQIVVVATMNILEAVLVPDLLLWGRMNAVWAAILILMIYFWAFRAHRKR